MVLTVRAVDVPLGKPLAVRVNDALTVAVCRVEDRFYAFDGKCPHRGAPLAEGVVQGNLLICPLHHFRFELSGGRCLMPRHLKLRGYPVLLDGETLMIDLQVQEHVPRPV